MSHAPWGGHAGGAAAWLALLGYNVMQIGLYGLFGPAMALTLHGVLGITVSWWILSFIAMAAVAVLGYRQIDLSLKVLGVLVAGEFLIVLLFDVMVFVKGGAGATGQALSMSSYTWAAFTSGAPGIGLLFAAASFVGFEATTIYSEEAREPHRTVPRATYIAVLAIGLFFMVTSWLMVNAYGDDAGLVAFLASDALGGDPTNFLFAMARPYIGEFLTNKVMVFLFASSLFAALLALNNAVARYAYALGREGLVPEVLGRTHAVHLSPHMGSLSQSALAFVVVGIFAVRGMDPGLTLYTWLGQFGGLSISYLMAFSAAAVFVFFRRNPGLDDNIWRTTVAPLVSAVGLLAIAVYSTSQFGFLIGNPESALRWLLPLLIPVAAVVGVASAQMLRSREPAAFALMGRHRALQLIEDENR